MNETKPYWTLHFLILLSSLVPSMVLLIQLDAFVILFYRTLIAVALFAVLIYSRHDKLPAIISQKVRLQIFLSGLLVILYWGLSFIAAKISNASVCLIGMATTSLWIVFLDPLLSKRKSKVFQIVIGLNAIIGIYIIFSSDFAYNWGLAVGIIGAFFGALLTIYSAKLSKSYHHYVVSYYQMAGACVGTLFFLPIYDYFFIPSYQSLNLFGGSLTDWLLIIAMAAVVSVFAYSTLIRIMQKIPPFTVALVSNLSPVYGTIIALLFFKEKEVMNTGFYVGTILLLFSVFAYPIYNYYRAKQVQKKKDFIKNHRIDISPIQNALPHTQENRHHTPSNLRNKESQSDTEDINNLYKKPITDIEDY
ncbi:MAG: EamA family transporter [Bernardetiaceae bacterium]|nr:EamA family transporter [Bernardetiaceae bacterium]